MSGKYKYIYSDDGSEMIENDGDYLTNMEEATDELNRLKNKETMIKDLCAELLSMHSINLYLLGKGIRAIYNMDADEMGKTIDEICSRKVL